MRSRWTPDELAHRKWWRDNSDHIRDHHLGTRTCPDHGRLVIGPFTMDRSRGIMYRDWVGKPVTITTMERNWDGIPFFVQMDEPVLVYDAYEPLKVVTEGDCAWVETVLPPLHVPTFTNATDAFLWLNELQKEM